MPAAELAAAGAVELLVQHHGCWLVSGVWIDLYSRRVVGWKLDPRTDAALVIEALNRALCQWQVESDQLLIPTDQVSHFLAGDYKDLRRKREIVFNMPAKCCGWDNAVVESFFSTTALEPDLEDDRPVSISPQQLE